MTEDEKLAELGDKALYDVVVAICLNAFLDASAIQKRQSRRFGVNHNVRYRSVCLAKERERLEEFMCGEWFYRLFAFVDIDPDQARILMHRVLNNNHDIMPLYKDMQKRLAVENRAQREQSQRVVYRKGKRKYGGG